MLLCWNRTRSHLRLGTVVYAALAVEPLNIDYVDQNGQNARQARCAQLAVLTSFQRHEA